jgi:dTDP-4-amino-4,6-dideoxygalactose transaminase
MQFLDLKAQYKSIKKEIDQAVKNVLDNCNFILGPEVENLENNIAKYCGCKYGIALNSGTDALFLSLKGLGIGPGDEVIVPSFTFIATAEAVVNVGAKPIFVDINPKTFNIDPIKIEEYLKKLTNLSTYQLKTKPKAIIPVHLFGLPAEMDKIIKIAKKYKLKIIEDAAQAIGAKIKFQISSANWRTKLQTKHKSQIKNLKQEWKMIGNIGDCGCLSFFPSKNLGGYGDGGMIVTNNKKLAERIRILRVHGTKKKYYHQIIGVSSRLDALQSAVLNTKLKHLDKWTKARQDNAEYYTKNFKNIKQIIVPMFQCSIFHVFNQYTIRAEKRDKLQKYLNQYNIPTQIYYPHPLHLQPAFKYLGYKKGDFPETEKATEEVISLPIYPELLKKDQDFIIKKIKEFYK